MIVKNEEDTLEKCLNSVRDVVDEIVIVDTGSSDRTKEIAAQFTDKIYDFAWVDDFSAARNFSLAQATKDYVLWLDADDILLPEDAFKFQKLKECLPPDIGTVMMKYNTGFDSHGNVTFSYYRERLAKHDGSLRWHEPVHEYLAAGGKRISTDICITHAKPHGRPSGRNIHIYEALLASGQELSARGTYYYARELKDHKRFADAAKWFQLFLDSGRGWMEDNITACDELAKCHLAQDQRKEALTALLRSFTYDVPRPEICCQLGYYFSKPGQYAQAAFWFELALKLDDNENGLGFQQRDCRGYIPCIELAVCYDKLGQYKKAMKYNNMAAKFKPDSPAVLYNKKYFAGKLNS